MRRSSCIRVRRVVLDAAEYNCTVVCCTFQLSHEVFLTLNAAAVPTVWIAIGVGTA